MHLHLRTYRSLYLGEFLKFVQMFFPNSICHVIVYYDIHSCGDDAWPLHTQNAPIINRPRLFQFNQTYENTISVFLFDQRLVFQAHTAMFVVEVWLATNMWKVWEKWSSVATLKNSSWSASKPLFLVRRCLFYRCFS